LVIATDGVLEAESADGTEFGGERLQALAQTGRNGDLRVLAAGILKSVNAFGKQTDNQTLLLIRLHFGAGALPK
jgi:serine phosphatase RsbU (regulator of sigma subunit)